MPLEEIEALEKGFVVENEFENVHIVVIKNKRLDFKNSETIVQEFIMRRLVYFNFTSISFVSREELNLETNRWAGKEKILVVIDIMNPLIDTKFVTQMITRLVISGKKVALQDGMVPGTQVDYVLNKGVAQLLDDERDIIRIHSQSQAKHNNQYNLYKYKRLKMFLFLEQTVKDMFKLSIDAFNDKLAEDDMFKKLLAYGEDIETFEHECCPHCAGHLTPLRLTMSQPVCGYLPTTKPLYHECDLCGLVVSSPYIDVSQTSVIYDVFDTEDFAKSHNNHYTENSQRCDFSHILKDLPSSARTLDLGGGMGNFSSFLKTVHPRWQVTHSDFSSKQIPELQKRGIATQSIDFVSETIGTNCYDLITAWEVLEHIPYEKLGSAIKNIYEALSPGGFFVFSTPDFDSPLCKSNDFFAMCPPFHYLVFGKKWLHKYFSSDERWLLYPMQSCSDFLDDSEMWGDYVSQTAPSFQLRATASIMKVLFNDNRNRKKLLENGMGTEVIVTLRKKL